jgi:hypothetical protein
VLRTGAGTGIARSWRVREGKKWTRSWATVVGSRPRRCGSSGGLGRAGAGEESRLLRARPLPNGRAFVVQCQEQYAGSAIPERDGVRSLRVRNAFHGHFEDPYDPRTESVCGKVLPPEAAAR